LYSRVHFHVVRSLLVGEPAMNFGRYHNKK
jgi:hypothetical protein